MREIAAYLAKLPADRRAALSTIRAAINAKLPDGYEETLQYGMITWIVPDSVLPAREVYNKQPLALASLGSQKNHMAVYLLGVYGDPKERAWFEKAYKATGKKLDMGKSCVRFKTLDALPVEVIADAMARISVERYVAAYRKAKPGKTAAAKKPAAGKPAAAKALPQKPATKRARPSTRRARRA